jgi:hypothetical protein
MNHTNTSDGANNDKNKNLSVKLLVGNNGVNGTAVDVTDKIGSFLTDDAIGNVEMFRGIRVGEVCLPCFTRGEFTGRLLGQLDEIIDVSIVNQKQNEAAKYLIRNIVESTFDRAVESLEKNYK